MTERRLLGRTLIVGVNTLASRVLGFVRDMVVATVFGAGAGPDAFFVAFRIPNLLRRLFAEGAFAQAFVPVLSEYHEKETPAAQRELVAAVAGVLGAATLVIGALGMLAAPLLVHVFAPGFDGDGGRHALASEMLRITFPYIAFISLTSLAGGVLNTWGRFAVPAFTPVLLNVCMIAAALWLSPRVDEPIVALAWGVCAAGAVQLLFQLPFLARIGMLVRPRLVRGHAGVRRVLKLMLPALFGVSVAQVNLLINTMIASFLVTGSVSWLYYSDRLLEFPLGLLGVALGTVILPSLSKDHATASSQAFSDTLDWALRWSVVVALPAATALAVLPVPLLGTLFGYGEFTATDVAMSARSLAAFALGLLPFVLVKVLAPGFYARQDTRTPVRIGVISMLANIGFNVVLVWPLAHAGLALATSLAAVVNAGLLYRELRRAGVHRPVAGWRALLLRSLVASAVMAGLLLWLHGADGFWSSAPAPERAMRLALLVGAGMASYGAVLLATGLRPRDLVRRETVG